MFASETTVKSRVPSSILKFITEASAQYDDLLKRQAFCTVSVDCFVSAESPEREYLGRISQGFFAFHALGAFGDAALHRLKHAKETVWLIDSHAQIPALALGAPTHGIFRAGISRLTAAEVRLFTTKALFWETCEHFWFARNVVREHGATSASATSARSIPVSSLSRFRSETGNTAGAAPDRHPVILMIGISDPDRSGHGHQSQRSRC